MKPRSRVEREMGKGDLTPHYSIASHQGERKKYLWQPASEVAAVVELPQTGQGMRVLCELHEGVAARLGHPVPVAATPAQPQREYHSARLC